MKKKQKVGNKRRKKTNKAVTKLRRTDNIFDWRHKGKHILAY